MRVSQIPNPSDKYSEQKLIYQLLNQTFHKHLNSLCYSEKVEQLSQSLRAVKINEYVHTHLEILASELQ